MPHHRRQTPPRRIIPSRTRSGRRPCCRDSPATGALAVWTRAPAVRAGTGSSIGSAGVWAVLGGRCGDGERGTGPILRRLPSDGVACAVGWSGVPRCADCTCGGALGRDATSWAVPPVPRSAASRRLMPACALLPLAAPGVPGESGCGCSSILGGHGFRRRRGGCAAMADTGCVPWDGFGVVLSGARRVEP